MKLLGMDDFKKEDGRIDWSAYSTYEIGIGRRCYKCRCLMYNTVSPLTKRLCYSCKELTEKPEREVTHDDYVRCPRCGHTDKISEWDCDSSVEVYTDGEHEINCSECDHAYTITTHVSYSYTSPKMLTDAEQKALDDALL
jgi:hypothetical protein